MCGRVDGIATASTNAAGLKTLTTKMERKQEREKEIARSFGLAIIWKSIYFDHIFFQLHYVVVGPLSHSPHYIYYAL